MEEEYLEILKELDNYYNEKIASLSNRNKTTIEKYTDVDWSQFLYAFFKRAKHKYPNFKYNIELCMNDLMFFLKCSNEPTVTKRQLNLFIKTLYKFSSPIPLTLYRGTDFSYFTKSSVITPFRPSEGIKVGTTITNMTPWSTSINLNSALPFAYDTLLEINLPKNSPGIWVKEFSYMSSEDEFILPPDTTFDIVEPEYDEEMEYILGQNVIDHYYVLEPRFK